MAEYQSKTISAMIDDINSGKMVLPAIQRNFVWPEDKICDLFDSLLRDYPIGTFLFWSVGKKEVGDFVFNSFINFHDEQAGKFQRGKTIVGDRDEYIGVLDGQQRITSIYIGLTGYCRTHIKGRRWEKDDSYVKRFLCLNILHDPADREEDKYEFNFIQEDKIGTIIEPEGNIGAEVKFWTPVSKVFEESFDAAEYMEDIEETLFGDNLSLAARKTARKTLSNLYNVFRTKYNVNYYTAENKSLTEVVDIFVRVNSGGQKLSASDLMLSIASAEQEQDIQVKMNEAINSIAAASDSSETGFVADNELILTAGLFFTGAVSLSLQKKENYTRASINEIFTIWDALIDSLCTTARYIEYIGFNGRKLTSKNLILPVAYYFYLNHLGENHKNSSSQRAIKDRIFINQWLLRAMITSLFRDGTGSTLISIRGIMDVTRESCFPLGDLMKAPTRRSLVITDDSINEILEYGYGDGRVLPLLAALCFGQPGHKYEVDHIWPQKKLMSKKELKRLMPLATEKEWQYYSENCHNIANLQILERTPNSEKADMLFETWVNRTCIDDQTRDRYFLDNCIEDKADLRFDNFPQFLDARRKLLRGRIKNRFPSNFEEIKKHYGFEEGNSNKL